MADPNTIYKMTVLTMLDKVDFPLSNTQLSNFFLEQNYTDYFTVQQVISGLLDSELIRFESTHNNTQYHITPLGKETLKYFADKITPAIEADITAYFEKNKMQLKEENAVIADFYRSTVPGYDVRCQDPVAYDLTYCTELAMGVYQLFSEGKTGCMVYVDAYGNVSPLYLADLQDPETGKIPPRIVDINAGTAQNYYNYIAHYVTEADYEAVKALGISNPEAYDFKKILEW